MDWATIAGTVFGALSSGGIVWKGLNRYQSEELTSAKENIALLKEQNELLRKHNDESKAEAANLRLTVNNQARELEKLSDLVSWKTIPPAVQAIFDSLTQAQRSIVDQQSDIAHTMREIMAFIKSSTGDISTPSAQVTHS